MAYKRPRPPSPSRAQKRSRGGHAAYVALGTELPDADKDGDDGAFVPLWQQTVTDERGRRRLHGAFTGGFSAGYFNTVGSKEGWTPKTFVSSRANRTQDQPQPQAQPQRAQDFMDEEDLAAAAESRQLETAQSFAGIGQGRGALDHGLFGLFLTQEETMGVKIAHKMGWRRDQGIGRKVRRDARLDDGSAASKDPAAHLFAPQDARAMVIPRAEVRRKGLGYLSEHRLAVVEETEAEAPAFDLHYLEPSKKPPSARKPVIKKSSFGVGVLNDTGSDDEDPYDLGPKIMFNKTLGKDKKAKKPSKFAKGGAGDKHVFVPKKAALKTLATLTKSSMDSRPPLKGFVLAAALSDLTIKRRYPPPTIPPGWKSAKTAAPAPNTTEYQSVADAAKASTLDAKGRSALLGETALPGKSVFDFISKADRDRLATFTGKTNLPRGRGEKAPNSHLPAAAAQAKDLWSLVPSLDKALAAGALAKGATGWMPYAEDLSKRARYTAFLELRAGLTDDLPVRTPGVSISQWTQELQEFVHAAQVFKPTTGIMASRFTSSTSSTLPGSSSDTVTQSNLLRQPVARPEDPARQAARMGMYGPMTRSAFAFYPSRLLCKRFNVPPPADMPPASDVGDSAFKSQTEAPVGKSAMDRMMHEMLTRGPESLVQRPAWMGGSAENAGTGHVSADMVPEVRGGGRAVVDVEKNDALAEGRAPEDVFKAIFGDDDEDDEEVE